MSETSSFEELLERDGKLVYTNVGVSMMPLLRQHRDVMVIGRVPEGERLKKYDAPLYKRRNGQYILHRILEVREKDYVVCGDNCWQKERVTDAQILGVLQAVVRDGREIPVTDKKYLWYVHLWCDFYPIRARLFWCRDKAKRALGKLKRMLK